MRRAGSVVVTALVLVGCGDSRPARTGGEVSRSARTSTADAAAPERAPSEGGPTDGISADEAKAHGVFVGDFDAKLLFSRTDGSHVQVVLTNVGRRTDTYVISLDPARAGTVTPRLVRLPAGRSATITATAHRPGSVRAFSRGRGAEVADAAFAP
jgi:hypothetical protein